MPSLRVVILEASPSDTQLLLAQIVREGFQPFCKPVHSLEELRSALAAESWDIVLATSSPSGQCVKSAVAIVRQADADLPFIVIASPADETILTKAMQAGASAYVLLPHLAGLGGLISRQVQESSRRRLERSKELDAERQELLIKYSNLFERAVIGIFRSIPEGRYLVVNPAFAQMFGYDSPQDVLTTVTDIGSQIYADPAEREKVIRKLAEGDAMLDFEYACKRKDGKRIWVRLDAQAVRDSAGKLIYFEGFLRDITQRASLQAELVMRDQAIQAVHQGIVITDPNLPDNPILYASPGFERMTGYASTEVQGRNCRFLQGPDTDKFEVARICDAIRDQVPYSCQVLNYRKDRTTFWNELSITPVRDPAGKVIHFVGVQTDVTARRNLEEQLRHSQKMEAVGRLAGGVAHDFNNLLTVINGYSEIALDKLPDGSPLREPLSAICAAGNRAAELTAQLSAFGRRTIVTPQVLDLNNVVNSIAKLLRRVIGDDITLATVLSPSPCRARIDPGQLDQVIMNLAVNARDAMPSGGRLTIETGSIRKAVASADCLAGEYSWFSVTDNGSGMSEEIKSQIFEPFFTTKGVGEGTGLGLAMVYGIVKQAGGNIQVESHLGQGAKFTVLLPQGEDPPVPIHQSTTLGEIPRGSATVLLAEDEDGVRAYTRQVLETQGYTVLEAASGAAAKAIADNHNGPIDLLMTDLIMPGLSGRELVDAIRSLCPTLQVLYISGYSDDAAMRMGVESSTDAFLQKPYTPLMLAKKVKEVLDTAPAKKSGK